MTSADARLAALLLANRITGDHGLRAADYWPLVERVPDPSVLLGADADAVAELVGDAELAARVVRLVDASVELAFACERLDESGIRVLSSLDDEFPARLRARLGVRCPPFLLVAGPPVRAGGIGVAGVREPPAEAADVATSAGAAVAARGEQLVTGLSPGVDRVALDAALAGGGRVVAAPAEGLSLVASRADTRSLVLGGNVTLVSPYGPRTERTTVTARGRNRIVYGLADLTLVVASDGDADTTFAGASEALAHGDGPVVAWVGPGCGPTNPALVEAGARPLADLAVLR